jgi:Na+/proline symporter
MGHVTVGGLTAVIWTDFIQTVLMIIGAIVLAILGRTLTSPLWLNAPINATQRIINAIIQSTSMIFYF